MTESTTNTAQQDQPTIPPAFPYPPPTILTYPASRPAELVTQGAEGRLYKTTYLIPSLPCALKHRPPKPYRHPALDARLTRARILAEARVLARCRRDGVPVPAVYAVDEAQGWLMMEWVEGAPVRQRVNEYLGSANAKRPTNTTAAAAEGERDPLAVLMRKIGAAVGLLHSTGVVHGDLTTSNMILRPWQEDELPAAEGAAQDGDDRRKNDNILEGQVVLIDFGLAGQGLSDEDRAVDLYVLERAFGSTHPRAEVLFPEVLRGYEQVFPQPGPVLRKLEDVRQRGRKRSMLG